MRVNDPEHEIQDLLAKIQYLIDNHVQLEEQDQCFTFPDGDTWYKTGKEPKPDGPN